MSLQEHYTTTIAPQLKVQLGLKNIMQVPHIEKVVINVGVGRFTKDKQYIENVEHTLLRITGLKPVRTKARQSISNFKIREGNVVGVKVTLRGKRMYDFLEKLLRVTLPRVRDFRGISKKGFDATGNYTLGFKEHLAFPEIKADEVDLIHGLEIVVHTTARDKETGLLLLTAMGFPFAK